MKCFTKAKGKGGQGKVLNIHLKDIEGYEENCISYDDGVECFFQMIQTRMTYKTSCGKLMPRNAQYNKLYGSVEIVLSATSKVEIVQKSTGVSI